MKIYFCLLYFNNRGLLQLNREGKVKMTAKIRNIIHFLLVDIWFLNLNELSTWRQFVVKFIRMLIMAVRGFIEDHCSLRASALTFYSVLSIVPVAALIFGIAKGFGVEATLKQELSVKFAEHHAVLEKIYAFADSMLKNAKSGMIAGVGVAVLFWTVMKVIGNIEHSFNYIWGVKVHRSVFRKFSDYMSLMLICPILIIMAGSANLFITTQLDKIIVDGAAIMPNGGEIILNTLKLMVLKTLPYLFAWMLFTFIYVFMPNTRVKISSALFAGVVAGTSYQMLQSGYIILQVWLSKYNAIYGSFSALPLFLIWLQLSWIIVLFGAELSFASQNVDTYKFEPHSLKVSYALRKLLTVHLTWMIVRDFMLEKPALTEEAITVETGIPVRLVRDISDSLCRANIISGTVDPETRSIGYKPAIPVEKISIQYVLEKIDGLGRDELPSLRSAGIQSIEKCLENIALAGRNAPMNKLLKDIAGN